jgi:hypothetical protein
VRWALRRDASPSGWSKIIAKWIAEKENVCYEFPFAGSGIWYKVDRWIGDGMRVMGSRAQDVETKSPPRQIFFIPNGHNPLKRLDSKK